MKIFEYVHTVAENEIDGQGHANNVAYIQWFQDSAIAHSSALGWTPERYREVGFGWVAKSHTIEYLRPSFLGEEIVVETKISERRRVAYTRSYRIVRRSDNTLLARGETVWAFINYETGRPVPILPEIEAPFG
jgi:acyl-CoA thioester hydrolase